MHVCTDSLPPGSQCKASDCAIEPALTCMHLHGKPMQHNQHRITSYLASVTSNLHKLLQEPCAASPEQQTTTSRGNQHKTDSRLPGGPSKRLAQSTIKCLTLKLNQPEASELTCHCPQEALYVHVYIHGLPLPVPFAKGLQMAIRPSDSPRRPCKCNVLQGAAPIMGMHEMISRSYQFFRNITSA